MYKEEVTLNTCCVQIQAVETMVTERWVTLCYCLNTLLHHCHASWAPSLTKGPLNFSVPPHSWEVAQGLTLVPALPGVFFASPPPFWFKSEIFLPGWAGGWWLHLCITLPFLPPSTLFLAFLSLPHFQKQQDPLAASAVAFLKKGVCRPPAIQSQDGCLVKNEASEDFTLGGEHTM